MIADITNEQILSWVALTNYAQANISPTCVIRPGRGQWQRRLQQLTPDERAILITKIARQEARLRHDCGTNKRYGKLEPGLALFDSH